ncbi:MAG: twin-arginine translocation signal domain-containing protein [Kiritimatiellaeota bacterium]|nr:twin-arginine translocation signal domain-containing protein [Kiritimatiellota bacterium]
MNVKPPSALAAYSRRGFLKHIAGGVVAAPFFFPSRLQGAPPPGSRITIGCIGVGNQGGYDTAMLLADPRAQIVAACDVDLARAKVMAAISARSSRATILMP